MLIWGKDNFIFLHFFNTDAYVQLEGKWVSKYEQGKAKGHFTLLDAKRWCTQIGNCFGIFTNTYDPTGVAVSIEFPVLLDHWNGNEYFIHKKEQIIGIIQISLCLLSKNTILFYFAVFETI